MLGEKSTNLSRHMNEKKRKNLSRNSSVIFTHEDTVVNISSYTNCVKEKSDILNLGPTFSTKHLNYIHMIHDRFSPYI